MDTINNGWAPRLQDVSRFLAPDKNVRVQVMRLDEIHPVISGNKWFKLKENIAAAKALGKERLITFGGAYSNHLLATAAAAKEHGLMSTGIVRGESSYATNPTLSLCADYGMELVFVSRDAYRQKETAGMVQELIPDAGAHLIIPEGGANEPGRKGAGDITAFIPPAVTHVAVSVGTGTTLAGILTARPDLRILGYCATEKCAEQAADILAWTGNEYDNWELFPEKYFGGFGKWNPALIHFMRAFYAGTGIPLDVVYTGKMMYALQQQILSGEFAPGADILCIHTGGLQGNPSGTFPA